ncbi:MAG: hypothetical protein ACRDY6_06265 [Acidimicrobiia bacterium]
MRRLLVVASLVVADAAAATPAAASGDGPESLRVVNVNVLHGVLCASESDGCQLPDRMELLGRRLQEASEAVPQGGTDTHLAAANPECDATTGAGCTSGRCDDVVDDMKDPNARQQQRIDFIFLKAPGSCDATFDSQADTDGDGLGTGIWDDPVVEGPGGMAFVSDHSGTSVDLTCEGS